jgi:hypothetical protein
MISSYGILSFLQANERAHKWCQLIPQGRGEGSVAAGARAHRWFKLGSDHEKARLDVAGETVAVAGEWQSGGASLSRIPLLLSFSISEYRHHRPSI